MLAQGSGSSVTKTVPSQSSRIILPNYIRIALAVKENDDGQ
jgi:hypothetical protein